jgi:hypothetical protein
VRAAFQEGRQHSRASARWHDSVTGASRQKRLAGCDFIGMDFDPTDDELFDLDNGPAEAPDAPDFRVSVQSSGTVRLVHWGPWLQSTGPVYTLLAGRERARVAIADLQVLRDDAGLAAEVIVQFHAGGDEAHRRALVEWARSAGYQRVWFDGEVVELESAAGGLVRTRCTGCGQRFIDGRSGWFWNDVRRSGTFPVACSLCGSDLPQWTPVERSEAPTGDAKVRRCAVPRPGDRAHRR